MSAYNIQALLPPPEDQKVIMEMIYKGVKAGIQLDPAAFKSVLTKLLSQGAQSLILGCTEIPIAFALYAIDLPHIDPTAVLAERAILSAGGTLRKA
jgi:aspartate racemase